VLLAVQVQGRLGQLVLPAEVCAVGAGPLAALAALRRHLARLRADNELASEAHVVRGTEACACQSQVTAQIGHREEGAGVLSPGTPSCTPERSASHQFIGRG